MVMSQKLVSITHGDTRHISDVHDGWLAHLIVKYVHKNDNGDIGYSHPKKMQVAIDEAYRILRPGGQLLLLDLKAHSFEKAHELYADVWLGFTEIALHAYLEHAGFRAIEVTTVAREETAPHFETLLAVGHRSR